MTVVRFRKAEDLHYLELDKDENGNKFLLEYIFYGQKIEAEHWDFLVDGKMIHHEEFPKNRDKYPNKD